MNVPQHISIIMDGNGRWAKQRGLDRVQGHIEGVKSVRAVTEKCVELGVKYLSLYAFSEENWNRPTEEVGALMSLLAKCMIQEYDTLMDNGVRFRVLGNRSRLSPDLDEAITNLEKATENNPNTTMLIMLSYSGKWDILQAAKKLAGRKPEEITMEAIDDALVTAGIPDPELLIRTSGEQRISNYMLWQTAYTEFVFTDTLWPDFRKDSLVAAIEEYSRRDRRFGKVK
ncbi:MAG: di-trans,poly-cis-decaprenylcistransferase [Bacteroidales bacterium]|nr:di-trans,poly-cis-decaprenylcistransferase [Bacteroidales bacterium]